MRVGSHAEGLGRDHWNEMLAYPRKPIAHWHPLLESKKSEKEVSKILGVLMEEVALSTYQIKTHWRTDSTIWYISNSVISSCLFNQSVIFFAIIFFNEQKISISFASKFNSLLVECISPLISCDFIHWLKNFKIPAVFVTQIVLWRCILNKT